MCARGRQIAKNTTLHGWDHNTKSSFCFSKQFWLCRGKVDIMFCFLQSFVGPADIKVTFLYLLQAYCNSYAVKRKGTHQ